MVSDSRGWASELPEAGGLGKAEGEVVEMTGEEGEPEKLMVIEGRGTTAGEGGPSGGAWMAKVLAKFLDSGGFETGGIRAVGGQWALCQAFQVSSFM
jgi:hypothetical protein